jgi:hypothetical protein
LHVHKAALGDATGFGKRSIARILGVSLDRLGGMDSEQDPELARMLSQVAQLSEADRAAIKRVLEAFTAQNAKK